MIDDPPTVRRRWLQQALRVLLVPSVCTLPLAAMAQGKPIRLVAALKVGRSLVAGLSKRKPYVNVRFGLTVQVS